MPLLDEMDIKKVNKKDLENSFEDACKDKEFVSLVKSLKLNKKEAIKKTSKLQNVME